MSVDDIDFEVRVDHEGRNYSLCVSYVGNDPVVLKLLQCQISTKQPWRKTVRPNTFCIFYISLACLPTKFTVKVTDDVTQDLIEVLRVQGDAIIYSFYNRAYRLGLDDLPVFRKLKGIGQRMMCLLLQSALDDGALKENSQIVLEASGTLGDKDMTGLIDNYQRMGFRVIHPEWLHQTLRQRDVPMTGTVRDVLQECSVVDANPVSRQLVTKARRAKINEIDT